MRLPMVVIQTPWRNRLPASRLNDHLKNNWQHYERHWPLTYAMDRDKRWERVKFAYDLFTQVQAKRLLTYALL